MTLNAKRLLASGALVGALCGIGRTQLIDVAFGNEQATPTGAAVVGQAGDQWNVMNAAFGGTTGPVSLNDSNGNGTGASVTFTSEGAVSSLNTGGNPDPALMQYYMFNNDGGMIDVLLSGLAASTSYDLYLYVSSDDAVGGNRALSGSVVGGTTVGFSATGDPQSTFVNGSNYVELSVISDASGDLNILEGPGNGNTSNEVDMNGLQIQPNATPEPCTMLLLGGAVATAVRRRAKRA